MMVVGVGTSFQNKKLAHISWLQLQKWMAPDGDPGDWSQLMSRSLTTVYTMQFLSLDVVDVLCLTLFAASKA